MCDGCQSVRGTAQQSTSVRMARALVQTRLCRFRGCASCSASWLQQLYVFILAVERETAHETDIALEKVSRIVFRLFMYHFQAGALGNGPGPNFDRTPVHKRPTFDCTSTRTYTTKQSTVTTTKALTTTTRAKTEARSL